jgi:hypothetical protein
MRAGTGGLVGILGVVMVCACASGGARENRPTALGADAPTDVRGPDGSYIIRSALLQRQNTGLLEILQRYVPNLDITHTSECPRIHLRGISTIVTRSDPAIYVSGQRAANTCILAGLSTADVDYVEIYPSGVPRSPYQTDPYGVILVFMLGSAP